MSQRVSMRLGIFVWGLSVVALILGTPAPTHADTQLVITSWGGNLQPVQRKVYFEPFAKETGTKVVEDEWGGEMAKLRAMVQSGAPSWDVVEVSDAQLVIGCNEGLLEPIDFSKVGGKDRFVPDAVAECGVGTNTSSAIIAYNADRFPKEAPSTLKDFFDVAKFPGPRALRKSPRFNMEIALLADGVPVSELYKVLGTEEGVARAFKKLDQIKPSIKVWFTQWAEAIQLLVDGEVYMTMNGNGRISAAVEQDKKNLKIIWDNQGAGYDFWAIVKGSKMKDAALQFINFASQDRNMTEFTKLFRYGPTVKTVINAMPPEIAKDMPSTPENMKTAYRVSASFWGDHNDDYTVRFNSWLAK
jgi:putative spermidine/putrescine transport system substrate-binding protein